MLEILFLLLPVVAVCPEVILLSVGFGRADSGAIVLGDLEPTKITPDIPPADDCAKGPPGG